MLCIELDSLAQVARLPADKLQVVRDLICSWLSRKWCYRRELESLIGHLHHAAKVVWPGRTFLRRMIDLLCCSRTRDHPIRLNQEFHRDLLRWHQFLDQWHDVSFWLIRRVSPPLLASHTPQLRGSSSVSVISWANSILQDLRVLQMNGRSVCSLPSWPTPSNILPSRFIFLLFEPSILIKGSLTLCRTVFVYSLSYAVLRARKASIRPTVYLSQAALCW